jgi:putative cardiolipin synthase
MVKPENCYALSLSPAGAPDKSRLTWRTEESGRVVDYVQEPGSSGWRRLQAKMLALVPMEREL